jgi:membrane-associated phospholipid phosphatase
VARLAPHRRQGVIAYIVALGLIGAISLTRLYLLAHFPMDLLGGWIAGGALLSVIVAVHVLRVDERLQAAGQTSPPSEASVPRRVAVPLKRPGASDGAAGPGTAPAPTGLNASASDPISTPARFDA